MELEQLNKKIEALEPGEVLRLIGIPAETYHTSKGLGSTAIKKACECMAVFKAYTEQPHKPPSAAMLVGSGIHVGILEPFEFEESFVRMPDSIKAKRGADWNEFRDNNEGRTVFSASDWEVVQGCIDSVLESFSSTLSGGDSEVSYWKRDESTNLILKGRMDYEKDGHVIDLKTCVSSQPETFSKAALNFNYHIQDSIYSDITKAQRFSFIAVGKSAPYICEKYEFGDEAKHLGYLLYRNAVKQIAQCIEQNYWPGYTSGEVTIIDLPPWELRKLEKLESKLY